MNRLEAEVSARVSWLSVHAEAEAGGSTFYQCVQERQATVFFFFHRKLDDSISALSKDEDKEGDVRTHMRYSQQ